MSTWNKASKINQKTHRERQQLHNRSHLGLLEKKKDYKARAHHDNQKKQIIKSLKKKALNRNPDEFYFHMVNSKVIDDVHKDIKEKEEHTPDQIKLMQGRDLKYIRTRRIMEKKKIEKLKSQLHFIDKTNEAPNSHIFFLDSDKEAETFDLAKRLNTHPSLVNRRSNRPRLEDLDKLDVPDLDEETVRKLNQKKNKNYAELDKRINREKELSIVERKLELKRCLVENKGMPPKRQKKGSATSAPVYKWKQERKK
ncbi:probable U3 small nucleolar RNA-associated protein 11 [Planococcus citri]|uniref:probable U3 small nucleolar RNA-associated protein 11 n=1 Tax=Planococcus citri TaxID=170843 RepID=UPI0031F82053